MSGQCDRLFGNAFHQTTVAGNNIGVMTAQRVAETGIQAPFRHCHADCRRNPLSERSGSHFHPGQMTVFRMAGGFGAELTEIFDIFKRNIFISQKIKQRVQKH